MQEWHGVPRNPIRSIFVSDLHLGWRYSKADAALELLKSHEPEYVYLVGDIFDTWKLGRNWCWKPAHSQLIRHLLELAKRGTQLRYTPGNHDHFLRQFLADFGFLEIADDFVHHLADGRRFLVLHGDQFDTVELRTPWLSAVGSTAYDALMWVEHAFNLGRRCCGLGERTFVGAVKRRIKRAITFVSDFERRLAEFARSRDCDGVICGHIHTPAATRHHGVDYFNTGDWVENRTALIEHADGEMELLNCAQGLVRSRKQILWDEAPATRPVEVPQASACA